MLIILIMTFLVIIKINSTYRTFIWLCVCVCVCVKMSLSVSFINGKSIMFTKDLKCESRR
jgi:hypothetical protein